MEREREFTHVSPQHPTIHTMSAHDKAFSVEVERLLGDISSPQYRQLIVEVGVALMMSL